MTSNYNDDEETRPRSRMAKLFALLVLLVIPFLFIWWPGCRSYPKVSSKESLLLVRMLNTACNTQDAKRLQAAEERLAQLVAAGQVTTEEQQAFAEIVKQAQAGQWQQAEAAALKMAQDQAGRSGP